MILVLLVQVNVAVPFLLPRLVLCQTQSQAMGDVDWLYVVGLQDQEERELQLSGDTAHVCK